MADEAEAMKDLVVEAQLAEIEEITTYQGESRWWFARKVVVLPRV